MAISNQTTGIRPGVCTSTTRPSNPYVGQLVFETDTFVLKYWNGTTWQGAISAPAGTVNTFAGSTAPAGWLLAYGQAVSRTTYADLYAIIGNTYGAGDGSTTFNIPDMRGRVVAGEDDMGGTAASRLTSAVSGVNGATLGATGGNQIMHAHDHTNSATFTGTAASHGHSPNAHSHSGSATESASTSFLRLVGVIGTTMEANHFVGRGTGSFADYSGAFPQHSHSLSINAENATVQNTSITPAGTVAMTNATFPPTAGGSSQNVQPTIILNYIIKF